MLSCMFELNKAGHEDVISFGRHTPNIQLFTVSNCYNDKIPKYNKINWKVWSSDSKQEIF